MRRVALLFPCLTMALDVRGRAYNSDLAETIAKRDPERSVARVLSDGPLITTIEHWASFLIGFGLLMTHRNPIAGLDAVD